MVFAISLWVLEVLLSALLALQVLTAIVWASRLYVLGVLLVHLPQHLENVMVHPLTCVRLAHTPQNWEQYPLLHVLHAQLALMPLNWDQQIALSVHLVHMPPYWGLFLLPIAVSANLEVIPQL